MQPLRWCFLACLLCLTCETITVTLGGALQLSGPDGPGPNSLKIKDAFDYFVNTVNKKNYTLNGEPLQFQVDIRDHQDNVSNVIPIYKDLIANSSINFLFAPTGSSVSFTSWSYPVAEFAESNNRLLLSIIDYAPEFWSDRNYVFSTTFPSNRFYYSSIPLLRSVGAKNVSFLRADTQLCNGLVSVDLKNTLERNGIKFLHNYTFPYTTSARSNESAVVLKKLLLQMKNETPDLDLIYMCPHGYVMNNWLVNISKEINWVPKAFLTGYYSEVAPMGDNIFDYFSGSMGGISKINFPDDNFYGTFPQVAEKFRALYNKTFESPAPATLILGHLLAKAIQDARTLNNERVAFSFARQRTQTFMGEFFYSVDHELLAENFVIQFRNNTAELVGPLPTATQDFIYPMPTWEERIYDPKWGDRPADYILVIFLCIGLCISIGWAIVLGIYRKHEVMIAASPPFMFSIIVGTLILYLSLLTWMTSILDNDLCNLRFWFLDIGFVLLFGSLFIKTWRIYALFSRNDLKLFSITNKKLALMLSFVMLVHVAILIVVSATTSTFVKVVVNDEFRPKYNDKGCDTTTLGYVLLWVLVGLNAVLFFFGAILAYYVRNVPYEKYDESKVIAGSIYNCGFFAIFVIAFQVSGANPGLIHVMSGLLVFLGAASTLSILFFHKIYIIKTKSAKLKKKTSSKLSSQTNPSSTNTEKEEWESKYSTLKQLYESSESERTRFQEQLKLLEKKNSLLNKKVVNLKQKGLIPDDESESSDDDVKINISESDDDSSGSD